MLCPSKLFSRDACTLAYSWNFGASFPRSCSCSLCREPRRRGTVACDVFYKRTVLQLPARPLFFFKVTATPQFAASFERLKLHAIHRINRSLESFILGNLTHTMHRTQNWQQRYQFYIVNCCFEFLKVIFYYESRFRPSLAFFFFFFFFLRTFVVNFRYWNFSRIIQ